ncbi:MAG: amidohydrolase [Chloroflexi bacterium]|nr:MAG: amidohydrolase [Chloroflexota bacterium]
MPTGGKLKIQNLSPDTILFNGQIFTLDAAGATAQAVAIKDGRIVAVGGNAEIKTLAGDHTRNIDLGGRPAIPGIFDSHNHLLEVGAKLSTIRLDECRSPEEMMELVRQQARDTPPGEWIVGQGWNEGNWNGRLPTRHDLDPATSDHPVVLMRFFNIDVVNSRALRAAGIDRHTPDPKGGKIERDAKGEPNGLLRASAKTLVRRLIPKPTLEQMKQSLRLACREMHRFGITSIVEPGLRPLEMRAFQSLYQDNELSLRVNLMPSWHGFHDDESEDVLGHRAREPGIYSGLGDEWLRIGGLEMAIDGGTTSHTAYMYEPYEGDAKLVAFNRIELNALYRHLRTAQELGWDVGIHCCGDHAQDMAVGAFAQVAREMPSPDARHNIVHGYFPTASALDQMAEYNIAAVLQPTFIYWEGDLLFRDVGERRAQNYKPARTYLDRGIVVTASSDVTSTVSANPFIALYALVTRKNKLGQHIAPQEAISREEALRAYTVSGTWLTREEHLKGTIEVGKLADIIVLDRDYFSVPDEEIKDIQVDMTIVGGDVVWQREQHHPQEKVEHTLI